MPEMRLPNSPTVLFAGGGTGGHLMPGLSVAQELRQHFPHSRLVFVGTSNPLERRIVEGKQFEHLALPTLKWNGSRLAAPRWLARMAGGLLSARRLVQRIRPDVAVSLGAYAAFAPALAAVLGNVPLVIMEQNAYPGKVNRLLSWWAQEVYTPWPGTEEHFAYPERAHVTGNPVRREFAERTSHCLAAHFGLNPRKRTLLITGGSQGAQSINRLVLAALPILERQSSWLQILHSTGAVGYEEARAAYSRSAIHAAVQPFIEDMPSAYAVSDLALCRAGGTTLAELTALGVPAVLIPLPSAANDHQRCNASCLAREGGAIIVDQSDLTPAHFARIVLGLLHNRTCLARMRAASLRLGRPAAARNVVRRLLRLLLEKQQRQLAATPVAGGPIGG